MKLSRSYLLGLGSGLILSALIAMVLPNQEFQHINNSDTSQNATLKPAEESKKEIPPSETQIEKPIASGQDQTNKVELTEKTFTVPVGASAERIGDLLVNGGWITNKEEFLSLIKQQNLASKFKAGNFNLPTGLSIEEIVNRLIK